MCYFSAGSVLVMVGSWILKYLNSLKKIGFYSVYQLFGLMGLNTR